MLVHDRRDLVVECDSSRCSRIRTEPGDGSSECHCAGESEARGDQFGHWNSSVLAKSRDGIKQPTA